MFSNYLVLLNSAVLVPCIISCHLPGYIRVEMETLILPIFVYGLSKLGIVLLFSLFILLISFLFVFLTSLITDVKVGKPPLDGFVFAYKYGLIDTVASSDVDKTNNYFWETDKVQICYERKIGPFGLAYGAMVNEDTIHINEERKKMYELGYCLLQVKQSGSALFVSCPKVPWLSYLGIWLILRILYPKIYKYSKDHKLSAYPVVEVYRKFSVMLVVPLSKQDAFVVPEARPIMRRAACDLSHSSAHNVNVSYSSSLSSSKSILSVKSITTGSDLHDSFTYAPKLINRHSKRLKVQG